MIAAGTIVYASADCDEAVQEAKDHAAALGLSPADARLMRKDGQILLQLRVQWDAKQPS